MSYQEKRTIVSILSGALLLAAYGIYTSNQMRSGALAAGDLKAWAVAMLTFIGIGIVAQIIIQIVFAILLSIGIAVSRKIQNQSMDDKDIERSIGAEMVEDERDRFIELKSNRVGFFLSGIGFVAALFALMLNYSPVVMLNILFVSFAGASLVEGATQVFYYRRA
jgi:hypothetical protein